LNDTIYNSFKHVQKGPKVQNIRYYQGYYGFVYFLKWRLYHQFLQKSRLTLFTTVSYMSLTK